MKASRKLKSLVALAVLTGLFSLYTVGLKVFAEDDFEFDEEMAKMQLVEQSFLLPVASPPFPEVIQKIEVIVTAYSSTVAQTDSTPFITASGEMVRDGIVANNLLAFNTAVRMPELFGDKIFLVKDRMHSRKSSYHFDIWFPTTEQAKEFGAQTTTLEILSN